GENEGMADLTAAEVHVLATLMENRPMTMDELARSLADQQLFLNSDRIEDTARGLVGPGLVELTPAGVLRKHRLTAAGRNWVVANSTRAW
ncbi:MAG: hypothetical protein ACRDPO_29330, partial [Streptosporangiaceae bacterium]